MPRKTVSYPPMSPAFCRAAWGFLGYTMLVVLWGAYVRATGSGAGCGDHWPLCNGEMIPRSPGLDTIVELTHRITSGLCWFGALGLAVWAFRRSPPRHPVRAPAFLAVFLMTTEALIGAGLVLFEMVANNASFARAYWMVAHLTNTFFLLAALAFVARGAGPRSAGLRGGWTRFFAGAVAQPGRSVVVVGALLAVLVAAAGGAVAALGDTLFPSTDLAEALRADLSPTAHAFVRLRVVHPVLAIAAGAMGLALAGFGYGQGRERRLSIAVGALVLLQIAVGFVNVALLAPVWMQLVHLLLADLLWIGMLLLSAELVGNPRFRATCDAPADVLIVADRQRQAG